MALRNFLRLRPQRFGKLLVFVLSACSISYFVFTYSKHNDSVVDKLAGIQQTRAVDDEQLTALAALAARRGLNVRIWKGLCGSNVRNVRQSLFFPRFPDNETFITDSFQFEDNKADFGLLISGFVRPATSGSYRFAIASDDSSELWFSSSEDPEEKRLIARVFSEESTGWTQKNELDKYPEQISKDLSLRGGNRYYIEVILKQGSGDGFVQVFWKTPGDADFKLISAEYLSTHSNKTVVMAKKDAAHIVLSGQHRHAYKLKSNNYSNEYLKFYSLPLIPKDNYLPQCDYRSSFVVNSGNIFRYEGLKMVSETSVYPADDTSMGDPGIVWTWNNRVADKEIIHTVVDKMIASLRLNTSK